MVGVWISLASKNTRVQGRLRERRYADGVGWCYGRDWKTDLYNTIQEHAHTHFCSFFLFRECVKRGIEWFIGSVGGYERCRHGLSEL